MKCLLQVLAPEGEISGQSILLFFDDQRYLFNVGEGCQRIINEMRVKMSSVVKNIFVSQIHPKRLGGLPGLLLTMSTHGPLDLMIHGPQNIAHMLSATRYFIHRNLLSFGAHCIADCCDFVDFQKPIFKDERITVLSVSSWSSRTVVTDRDDGASARNENIRFPSLKTVLFSAAAKLADVADRRICSFSETSLQDGEVGDDDQMGQEEEMCRPEGMQDHTLEDQILDSVVGNLGFDSYSPGSNDVVLTYIVHLVDVPGKFDAVKAARLGVPKGPSYGKLTKGESITLEDGRIIAPCDVIGPPTPGPVIILVDCPTVEHMNVLVEKSVWSRYHPHCADCMNPSRVVMVHAAPENVLTHPTYVRFASAFGPDASHIITASSFTRYNHPYVSSVKAQALLNYVCPQYFPFEDHLYVNGHLSDLMIPTSELNFSGKVCRGDCMLTYHLAPLRPSGFDASTCAVPLSYAEYVQQIQSKIPDLSPSISIMKSSMLDYMASNVLPNSISGTSRDAELVFLGTGSAMPSKYRNVSGIMLCFDNLSANLLIDSGEASIYQIRRLYGKNADEVISHTDAVWISHMHGDHHIGLVHFMFVRHELLGSAAGDRNPIFVIGPSFLKKWLDEFMNASQRIPYQFLACDQITPPGSTHSPEPLHTRFFLDKFGLTRVANVPVFHCRDAYGLILEHRDGWKLVYSGDTRPCHRLVTAGMNATFCVHEATFEDALLEEALAKNHSTTGEAVSVGSEMHAWRTVLTHFSQRYPKIPAFDESYKECTCIAFDLMRIRFKDAAVLPLILPSVKLLFKEEEVAGDSPAS
eukprot:ANDGO_03546.mRNA.1 Ribonuclease Z 1